MSESDHNILSRDSLPVLPLRDIVVFPHMIVPLFVGRDKSIRALEEAMAFDGPAIVNVILDPRAGRKPQQFAWLTKDE